MAGQRTGLALQRPLSGRSSWSMILPPCPPLFLYVLCHLSFFMPHAYLDNRPRHLLMTWMLWWTFWTSRWMDYVMSMNLTTIFHRQLRRCLILLPGGRIIRRFIQNSRLWLLTILVFQVCSRDSVLLRLIYWPMFSATSTAIEHLFSQGQQLLHFTRNCLLPSMIHAFLCLGDWGKKDLVNMPELVGAIRASHLGKKHAQSKSLSSNESL